jgi:hypothetical protein
MDIPGINTVANVIQTACFVVIRDLVDSHVITINNTGVAIFQTGIVMFVIYLLKVGVAWVARWRETHAQTYPFLQVALELLLDASWFVNFPLVTMAGIMLGEVGKGLSNGLSIVPFNMMMMIFAMFMLMRSYERRRALLPPP